MENIDRAINKLEFYLRGKFRAKYSYVAVRKFYSDASHFYVNGPDGRINYKYTTSCYIPKQTAESDASVFAIEADGIPNDSVYLKIPRRKAYYESTWGKTDYIVCQYYISDTKTSFIYYINRKKLFDMLSKGIEVFEDFISWDIGIPLRTLMKQKIVEDIDCLDWSNQSYKQVFTTENVYGLQRNYFINRWNSDSEDMMINNRTAFFPNCTYRVKYQDRSKSIRFTSDKGVTIDFESIIVAATQLNITSVSISRVLNKKQNKLFCNYNGEKIRITSIEEV